MTAVQATSHPPPAAVPGPRATHRLGCVSFLNARPLIDGLESDPRIAVRLDVPSRLLAALEAGEVDVALCPVIDYQTSALDLRIVPVGCIGSRQRTLTVRLFSRVPPERLERIHVDGDSRTSVALLRIILAQRHGLRPQLAALDPRWLPGGGGAAGAAGGPPPEVQAALLIGDKVVTAGLPERDFPHQLDLGDAWLDLTGLPFVFAAWMCRVEADLGPVPRLLDDARQRNLAALEPLVQRHAAALGWPPDLARPYLGQWLCYELEAPQLRAIEQFHRLARRLGLIDRLRPLRVGR